jgi:hypothetical protein
MGKQYEVKKKKITKAGVFVGGRERRRKIRT